MIRFRLTKASSKAPYLWVWVRVEKSKSGKYVSFKLSGLEKAAEFIAKGFLIRGPHNVVVRLVPKGDQTALHGLRAILPSVVKKARRELSRILKDLLQAQGREGREVPLFKGHRVWVPPWALTARVLVLGSRANQEFTSWLEALVGQESDEDEGDELPLEGPHFGSLEDKYGLSDRGDALLVHEALQTATRALQTVRTLPEVDLVLALYDRDYFVRVGNELLRLLNLDWPVRFPSAVWEQGGVHPLFVLIAAARLEAQWGALADRLGTLDGAVLRAARRYQRLRGEGLSPEEAREAAGLPVEVSLLLEEGDLLPEYQGEEEDFYVLSGDPLEDTIQAFQEESLEEALEAWGITSGEALVILGTPFGPFFKEEVKRRFEEKRRIL